MDAINMFDNKTIYTYFISNSKDEKTIDEDNFQKTCDYLSITPKLHDSGKIKLPFTSLAQNAIYNSLAGPSRGITIDFPKGINIRVYEMSVRDYTKVYVENHLFKNKGTSSKEINQYVDDAIELYQSKVEEIRRGIVEETINQGQKNNKNLNRTKIENHTKSMSPKEIIEEGPQVNLKPENLVLSNIFFNMWHTNNIQNTSKHIHSDHAKQFVQHLNMHNSKTIMDMRSNTYFYNSKHKLPEIEDNFYRSSR